jgi:hypothetical protein
MLHLEYFSYSYQNIILNYGKYMISKFKNEFIFGKKIIIHFVNVENNPRLQYKTWMDAINFIKLLCRSCCDHVHANLLAI